MERFPDDESSCGERESAGEEDGEKRRRRTLKDLRKCGTTGRKARKQRDVCVVLILACPEKKIHQIKSLNNNTECKIGNN